MVHDRADPTAKDDIAEYRTLGRRDNGSATELGAFFLADHGFLDIYPLFGMWLRF